VEGGTLDNLHCGRHVTDIPQCCGPGKELRELGDMYLRKKGFQFIIPRLRRLIYSEEMHEYSEWRLSLVNDIFFLIGSRTLGHCFSSGLLRRLGTQNELIWETEANSKGDGGGVVRRIC
jgi:hypothetical protein